MSLTLSILEELVSDKIVSSAEVEALFPEACTALTKVFKNEYGSNGEWWQLKDSCLFWIRDTGELCFGLFEPIKGEIFGLVRVWDPQTKVWHKQMVTGKEDE